MRRSPLAFHQLPTGIRLPLRSFGLAATMLVGGAGSAPAIVLEYDRVRALHQSTAPHVEQAMLTTLVDGNPELAFETAFEIGDELFETVFKSIDGVGANVGNGQRFTRMPRADLRGGTEWFNHKPARLSGPNAENCNACHNLPFDDGAGNISGNIHRDPRRGGQIREIIQRNAPHVFAPGAVQRCQNRIRPPRGDQCEGRHVPKSSEPGLCRGLLALRITRRVAVDAAGS